MVVYGQGGNDTITIDSHLTLDHLIYGGDGADSISGGNGNGIQFGGDGNDALSTGNGRDILIGGSGADTLKGGNDDDILSAGSTAYDAISPANQAPMCAIAEEWNRTDASYPTRMAHLTGITSGGLNGSNVLTASGAARTVLDDTSRDTVTGGLGLDWYLLNKTGGTVLDRSDATSSEVVPTSSNDQGSRSPSVPRGPLPAPAHRDAPDGHLRTESAARCV